MTLDKTNILKYRNKFSQFIPQNVVCIFNPPNEKALES